MSTATPTTDQSVVTESRSPTDHLQSRWGHHPCSYETYKKLKDLNKVYIRERNYFHALCRQLVKAPRHRTVAANCVSTAMNLPGPFITQYRENERGTNGWGGHWWYRSMPSTIRYENGYTKRYPAKFDNQGIPMLYRLAKYPKAVPFPIPFNQSILDKIDSLHRKLCN